MNIVVNGGSKGIGKETVAVLAKDPHNQILVTGRDEPALKKIADNCTNQNVSYTVIDLISLEKHSEYFKEQVYNRFSKVDILINNAGLLIVKDFIASGPDEGRQMMEANLFGPSTVIRILFPIMAKGSHIVNISSMGGYQGSAKYRGLAWYSASKAALAVLTECLAEEFSEFGISVNCLALGSVQTEMFESAFPGAKAMISPQEMAEFISEFAIKGNRYFNGKILPVALKNP
ncbi:MAG: SDR family oxidoreductase [Bacteroidales bacterium]|nr:SDR family oxidoreductase [Bacteroidales bacterium]